MRLRFSTGIFRPAGVSAFAINDFESMIVGPIIALTGAANYGVAFIDTGTFQAR
jgi:hypothetical protein